MGKQILIIYAATTGCLDDVPLAAIPRYEQELYAYFDTEQKALFDELVTSGELTDDLKTKLDAVLKPFSERLETRKQERSGHEDDEDAEESEDTKETEQGGE